MSKRFSLKDHLFNKKSVTYFAGLFYAQDKSFPKDAFIKNVLTQFLDLELKQRITCMRDELARTLPDNYEQALTILLRALPPELDTTKTDDDFGEFILAPFAEFVAHYGCTKKYVSMSLQALCEMTKRFSAENAIRYFINAFPKETFIFLTKAARSDNYHVRRLSSEGTRPKLPWCPGIITDYKRPLEILDILFADTTRYVTRSVANHMNDISKIDPKRVVAKLKEWKESGKQDPKEMDFIMNHALRTLIKKGDREALAVLGYLPKPKIRIDDKAIHTPQVRIGGILEFSFAMHSLAEQHLMIDYIVHHQTRSGTSEKIFKIKKLGMKRGESITLSKKQAFRVMTTRKLYPGEHKLELQINGVRYPLGTFQLVTGN